MSVVLQGDGLNLAPPSPANTRLGCKLVMFLKTLVQKVLIGPKNKLRSKQCVVNTVL